MLTNRLDHRTSSRPLQIAVVGVGGIGSTFAFQLARTGLHDVTAIARPGSTRLEQLRRDGGIVDTRGDRAVVKVADELDERTPYDVVIVTLQTHRLAPLLPALRRSAARCVLFMANNFDAESVRDTIGADRCCFGMPFVQGSVARDGRLRATIGAGGQRTRLGQRRWVDVFEAAGLPAVLEPDMPLWLRCHVPLCIAFEAVSVAGVRRGGGASWAEAMAIALGVQDSFALIVERGERLYPKGKARLHASPVRVVAAMLWFMSRIKSFRELLATGADECGALVDVLLASAARMEPAFPTVAIAAIKPIPASVGEKGVDLSAPQPFG